MQRGAKCSGLTPPPNPSPRGGGIRIGNFQPRLWPTLITLLCLPILLGLGTWQVHRLQWKQALLKTIDERMHDAPLEVPYVGLEGADYRPASAKGVYKNDGGLFLFATDISTGKGGYHVLAPLQVAGGQYLLVDRGWIPYDRKNGGFAKPLGEQDVRGILRVPSAPGWLMPRNDPVKGNWYSVDLTAMAGMAKVGVFLPYILEAGDVVNEGGYPIGGQTRMNLPNDHFSYAVTWYSFAAILLIIYGVSSFRRTSED